MMLFLGTGGVPPVSEFVPTLLLTQPGLGLLIVGTIVAGILALIVYAISAISVPLLMTHQIDAVTAMSASIPSCGARHRDVVRRIRSRVSADRACDLARLPRPRCRYRCLRP